MSGMSFCIVCLRSILWLFIWLYSAPLWLYVVTFHWACLPSTLPVHIMFHADKLSFLIHRQQQMWLEGNLIYLEYYRNGRKLLYSNICKCIHHRHPAIPTLADDDFVISMWFVLNGFLMVHINSLFFMLLHWIWSIKEMCWTKGGWCAVDKFLFFVSLIVFLICVLKTSGP